MLEALIGIVFGGGTLVIAIGFILYGIKCGVEKGIGLIVPRESTNADALSIARLCATFAGIAFFCCSAYFALFGEGGFAVSRRGGSLTTSSPGQGIPLRSHSALPNAKGSDIAVRASYDSQGAVKRRAHIRSYPDGIKSNNYSSNPGLFEAVYGPTSENKVVGASNDNLINPIAAVSPTSIEQMFASNDVGLSGGSLKQTLEPGINGVGVQESGVPRSKALKYAPEVPDSFERKANVEVARKKWADEGIVVAGYAHDVEALERMASVEIARKKWADQGILVTGYAHDVEALERMASVEVARKKWADQGIVVTRYAHDVEALDRMAGELAEKQRGRTF